MPSHTLFTLPRKYTFTFINLLNHKFMYILCRDALISVHDGNCCLSLGRSTLLFLSKQREFLNPLAPYIHLQEVVECRRKEHKKGREVSRPLLVYAIVVPSKLFSPKWPTSTGQHLRRHIYNRKSQWYRIMSKYTFAQVFCTLWSL